MSQEIQDKSKSLRYAVSFRKELMENLLAQQPGAKFYHPLPRDSRWPTIPFDIDNTSLNGWDEQSRNGYFVRTILIQYLAGAATPPDVQTAKENHLKQLAKDYLLPSYAACGNSACVVHPDNGQREVQGIYYLSKTKDWICSYCDKPVGEKPGASPFQTPNGSPRL